MNLPELKVERLCSPTHLCSSLPTLNCLDVLGASVTLNHLEASTQLMQLDCCWNCKLLPQRISEKLGRWRGHTCLKGPRTPQREGKGTAHFLPRQWADCGTTRHCVRPTRAGIPSGFPSPHLLLSFPIILFPFDLLANV